MIKKIGLITIVVLLAGGIFTGAVSAQGSSAGKSGVDLDPNHRTLIGQVQEIGDSQFTIQGLNGEQHLIKVTDETVFRTRTGEQPGDASFGDLQIGMYVGVYNHDSSGEFSARLVVLLPEDFEPSQLRPIRIAGEVSMVTSGGGFFKIETRKGDKLTIQVDEKTSYGGGIDSLEDLEKGDMVAVLAVKQENGDLQARAVATRKIEPRLFAQTNGKLIEISQDQITITDRQGLPHTFSVTENTVFKDRSAEVEGIEDLEIGMALVVVHLRETEANEARAVLVADEAILHMKRIIGKIKSVNQNQLTLDVNGEVMHFIIDENTRINGWNISELEDLEKDLRVLVIFKEEESGKLVARSISGVKRHPGNE